MSVTVIFVVGIVVFTLTVWGTVMAGGYWLTEIAESEEKEAEPRTGPPPSSADTTP